jgi:hypothetical protein
MSFQTVHILTCDKCGHSNGCDGSRKGIMDFLRELANEGWFSSMSENWGQRHICPACVQKGIR